MKSLSIIIEVALRLKRIEWKQDMIKDFAVRLIFGALLVCVPVAACAQKSDAHIPFVGCRSDGQLGPMQAQRGTSRRVPIAAGAAQRLAYYKAEDGDGVLAPRGWYCFGTYGSNGETLYVSPDPVQGADLLSPEWKGFTGPVVQLSGESGDTSGRFGVARMMARVFPSRRGFVRKVIAEGIEPAATFPFGPYPADELTYQGKDLVEYETPPETEGLGTQSRLLKGSDPIRGLAILVGDVPDLVYLAVRLRPGMADLSPIIIQQAEQKAAKTSPKN